MAIGYNDNNIKSNKSVKREGKKQIHSVTFSVIILFVLNKNLDDFSKIKTESLPSMRTYIYIYERIYRNGMRRAGF